MPSVSGDLITRLYSNFRGVDFTKSNNSLVRSPDSLNMWKNYKNELGKNIETRPGIELYKSFNNTIYGIFFYKIQNIKHIIIHSGVKLYDYNMNTQETNLIKENGLNPRRSYGFVFDNIFYFKDGINYLQYDGATLREVIPYIPTTTISKAPSGAGTTHEDVNLLTGERKNSFCADGESTRYVLDGQNLDANYIERVWVNGTEIFTGFTVNKTKGYVDFSTAPEEPDSVRNR